MVTWFHEERELDQLNERIKAASSKLVQEQVLHTITNDYKRSALAAVLTPEQFKHRIAMEVNARVGAAEERVMKGFNPKGLKSDEAARVQQETLCTLTGNPWLINVPFTDESYRAKLLSELEEIKKLAINGEPKGTSVRCCDEPSARERVPKLGEVWARDPNDVPVWQRTSCALQLPLRYEVVQAALTSGGQVKLTMSPLFSSDGIFSDNYVLWENCKSWWTFVCSSRAELAALVKADQSRVPKPGELWSNRNYFLRGDPQHKTAAYEVLDVKQQLRCGKSTTIVTCCLISVPREDRNFAKNSFEIVWDSSAHLHNTFLEKSTEIPAVGDCWSRYETRYESGGCGDAGGCVVYRIDEVEVDRRYGHAPAYKVTLSRSRDNTKLLSFWGCVGSHTWLPWKLHKRADPAVAKSKPKGATFELPSECKEFVKTMDMTAPFVQTGTREIALAMAAFFRAFDEANENAQ